MQQPMRISSAWVVCVRSAVKRDSHRRPTHFLTRDVFVLQQPGDKIVQVSASFGDDVWDAKNFGQVSPAAVPWQAREDHRST